ncbi:TPA: ABC-F family ATP-binding cassette domain-containing protein [Streptococcus suis]|nr:ABC-F family ATP-binding cassette domain-containing protein [Streptococcus suis]
MLQIKNLTINHQKDFRPLVNNLSISIQTGDKVAIIGEEGNGKSSLLKLIMDPKLVQDFLHFEGEVLRDYSSYAYLPQSLSVEKAEQTLCDFFFGDPDLNLDYQVLYTLADQLAFDSQRFASDQELSSLSGGEKLKVQLIKILAQDSQILFLDEPSNDLDIDTLLWLENYIATSPKTILFVSHDEWLLAHTANKIIHLESVKKKSLAQTSVQTADYQTYRSEREQAYQKQVHQARNDRKEFDKTMTKHLRQKAQVRHTLLATHDATMGRLIAKKMKNVLSREKRFEKMKENLTPIPYYEDGLELDFSCIQPLPAQKKIVKLDHFQLKQENHVLAEPVSLLVRGQEKIGIIGPNGIGKSSLIQAILSKISTPELKIGYMPQDYHHLLDSDQTPLAFLNPSGDQDRHHLVLSRLASLQFTRQEVHHAIQHLSGGQKAKLLLLKMALDQANFLLLDEPSRNFSPTSQPRIRQLLADYPGGLICVSHDRLFLQEVCHTVYQLSPLGLHQIEL